MLAEEAPAMTNPEDERATPDPGHSRLRASHADREQVTGVLKAAFVQGRLTQDELDTRVGQALAARTYADLTALTADLPAELTPASAHAPAPSPRPRNAAANNGLKFGAYIIGGTIAAIGGMIAAVDGPAVAAVMMIFGVILTAVCAAVAASLIAMTMKLESMHRNRSRRHGQAPPGPAEPPGPPGPPGPHGQLPAPAGPRRRPPRRPHGSLAVGNAG
jgi:hypothetical protein